MFFNNITEILVYSVIGTILAAAMIGGLLYASQDLFITDWSPEDYFSFASIISSVDPVAVISIMQQMHVNDNLLLLILGESISNDAISLSLFDVCSSLTSLIQKDSGIQIFGLAVAKFIVSVIMALLLGAVITFIFCLIIKYSQKLQSMQALLNLLCAYICFILSDILEFSGVIACMTSAMISVRYCQHAMSKDQRHFQSELLEILSSTLESILFLDMGIEIVDIFWHDEKIDYWFVFLPIVYSFVARFIAVPLQTVFLNLKRSKTGNKISWKEQLCLIWCGLRGGVSFSIACSWNLVNKQDNVLAERQVKLSTSVLILFTILFYGLTIKPLVMGLNIKRQKNFNIYSELLTKVTLNVRRFDQALLGTSNALEFYLHAIDQWLQKIFLPKGTQIDRELVQQVTQIVENAVIQQRNKEEEEERNKKMAEFRKKYIRRQRYMSYESSGNGSVDLLVENNMQDLI